MRSVLEHDAERGGIVQDVVGGGLVLCCLRRGLWGAGNEKRFGPHNNERFQMAVPGGVEEGCEPIVGRQMVLAVVTNMLYTNLLLGFAEAPGREGAPAVLREEGDGGGRRGGGRRAGGAGPVARKSGYICAIENA